MARLRSMTISLWLLALSGVGIASAATDALLDCADIAEDSKRLACYDELAAAHRPAPVTATTPVVVTAFDADEFGIEARHRATEPRLEAMTARVTRIDHGAGGKRIFALDNEQVWIERIFTRRVRVAPGDEVTIRSGSLGSFRLFAGGKSSTRVERRD